MRSDEENEKLCDGCTKCCEYVAIEIDQPEDWDDFQNIIWYVLHEGVWVFTDDEGDWYVQFDTKCKKLDDKGLCQYYDARPKICREHDQDDCEMHGEGTAEELIFKTPEDVLNYMKLKRIKKKD